MNILRVATVYDVVVGDLPSDLQVLSGPDLRVIEDSTGYFQELAEGAKYDWLRRLLREFGDSGWKLEFFAIGERPFVPYFRFYSMGTAICLPRGNRLRADLPDVLSHFYSFLGGFQENAFGISGGVDPPDQLCTIDELGVRVSDGGEVDPKEATSFLETYSGSHLCYLPDGRGVWLKGGDFEPVESLESEMAGYFEALLQGSRI